MDRCTINRREGKVKGVKALFFDVGGTGFDWKNTTTKSSMPTVWHRRAPPDEARVRHRTSACEGCFLKELIAFHWLQFSAESLMRLES